MLLSKAEEGEMFMPLKDWRKALKTPPSYRVGKNAQKCQIQLLGIVTGISLLLLFFFYSTEEESSIISDHQFSNESSSLHQSLRYPLNYDNTYPLTKPIQNQDTIQFKIGLVSDMDHSSKSKLESNTWISYYLHGMLVWNPAAKTVSVSFDKNNYKTLKTKYSHNSRGMELSELVTFNGKLLSFDDRTGLVFIIEDDNAYPWLLLTDGDGKTNKGFKAEWATVKNGYLYVGSMGKEWTSPQGELINYNPMWVKRIGTNGEVVSLNWKDNYISLRSELEVYFPGYMLHESGVWSDIHKKWFFLPRRMSHERYNEEKDEEMGTNVLLSCDEDFKHFEVVYIGEVLPTHGYSSFKFIPGTKDEVIVALKTEEFHGRITTYITAFTIHGTILLNETKIDDIKYEGFEFI
ncbi:apyrase [Halyomorpha halys]|uniref:apyrase n=1 Tax=Halyomorpha halys TaxID=286706 RepID=UPI0006D4FDA8|nr:apyrase [Halyomorpha halys]